MKIKAFYTKVFTNKKILLPFFLTIVGLQIIMAVLSMVNEQHWIIFADSIAALGLIIAIFLCNHYNKLKAQRILSTLVFFTQAVFLTAYSFQPFPKAPDAYAGLVAFIVYILYAFTFFSICIASMVVHANLNRKRNEQSTFAIYILYTIELVFSLILIIGALINFGRAGYTHMLMVDFINYIAYGIINFYLITLGTLTLPKATEEKKIKNKK